MREQAGLGKGSGQHPASVPVVLITGASAGIGEAIAHRFAAAGYRIVAVARRQEKLDALARGLSHLTQVETLSLDVAEPASAARAVRFALDRFGRLDCLVNNAGSGRWAPVHQTDDAAMDEVIDISLKATFRFCREAVPALGHGSSIVTVGSTFGLIGGLDGGIYCAVKAALVGLTQTLAAQYGPQGIRSNLVAPGVIKTDMTRDHWDLQGFRRLNQEMTPFDREGTVQDVANAVFFLASPEGSYINGQSIAVDGGWTTTKFLATEALVADRVLPQAAGAAASL
ncbi:3-oxoacyl-[acyl-carrier protein] reductase [Novosphingobium sp. PhB57]|uniref:SDR family NAD(P)-dependent oxidoreductase n=1 Tax=Novosphingobium sp. PhB57 TaxID=2485107 RepID=UPI001047BF9A|nr:SDR family oxidoreductase [Novosphingobium sp. PhB57]TCU58129.1 3-oxoacyl-[acyl-carrier protein] reductase [Novosphingobium sp. PhB57]